MKYPNFNITINNGSVYINIYDIWLQPLGAIIDFLFGPDLCGMPATHQTKYMLEKRILDLFSKLEMLNYVFLSNNIWRFDVVRFVANMLGRSIEHGELAGSGGIPFDFYISNKEVLAKCLVNQTNGELFPQVSLQPGEIIEWFAEEINVPMLHEAVQRIKNKMILRIANIE